MQKISVIGLGKLGAPLLATIAERGFEVVGVDIADSTIEKINKGEVPVEEPDLAKLLKKNRLRIKATKDYSEAIKNTDITLIIVPTPSKKNGTFTNRFVLDAVKNIAKVLKIKNKYHLVVVTSTVIPGSMDKEIVPVLEKVTGKKAGKDFGVCYNPEFIALGSVIKNLLEPDLVLIGESDLRSGRILENFYHKLCINKPPIVRMNFVNAEIAKIALNSYITTKISFANTLMQICEKIPGGNVDDVARALGFDSRIGAKYLKGGLPYGGPCFPRDNRAFNNFAKNLKVKSLLARSSDKINNTLFKYLSSKISSINPKGKIAILGLSYKKDTDVVEESAGIKIANSLAKKHKVIVWDPTAIENAKKLLSPAIRVASSLKNCLSNVDIAVITIPWDEFGKIKPAYFKGNPKKTILIDCWGIVDQVKLQKVANIQLLGQSYNE
ncbi:hypothetical protein A2164_03120 [Candidatus Curtissbacteria bacterium RBG_13_35_7]|uniref:UDP-glucose 6-dehydrogenase n=1 Tax=Candidatus Curtissbacteria bacterium RBG_13_35_7 TaxID=1797705 RepID=A0A1F5G2Y2_9BACT|nr:MAG: hypothetical protein A2164_03120 [Candidatus Curtissbacteria bacterium RBG_13_35_7]